MLNQICGAQTDGLLHDVTKANCALVHPDRNKPSLWRWSKWTKIGRRALKKPTNQSEAPSKPFTQGEWRWLAHKLKPSWKLQALGVIGLCSTSLLWLVDPLIIQWLIDVVMPARSLNLLRMAVLLLLAAFGGRFFLLISSLYMSTLTSQRLVFSLRRQLFAKLQRCSAEFFEARQTGDLSYMLEQDIDQVGTLGADIIPTLVRIVLTGVLTMAMMFRLNWALSWLVIIFLPLFVVLGVTFRRMLQRAASRSRTAASHRNSLLVESLTGAIQIQLLGALAPIRRRYVHGVADALRANLAERRRQLVYSAASLCTVACATTIMLGFGGIRVIHGTLTVGGYVAFYTYLLRLFEPLNTAIDMHSRLQKGRVSAGKLMELESLQVQTCQVPHVPRTLDPVREVSYRNVSFSYRNGRQVLHGIDLAVNRGERLALVGTSGSGKSSLIKLLARLYELPEGTICINGVDIREMHPDDLRKLIGVVPQEPVLFEGTLRENLLFGKPDATDVDIEQAIYIACLEEVISKLPAGLEHRIGQFGTGFSGGEKQRLALARVVIQQRPILVLDEATSAVDSETKAAILSRLAAFTADRVVLVISHDSVHRAWADRGLLIQDGTCAEFEDEHSSSHRSDMQFTARTRI
jgi:ABC-type bacteriocin/lantibiotic exporter with double-glycine peptidase domain